MLGYTITKSYCSNWGLFIYSCTYLCMKSFKRKTKFYCIPVKCQVCCYLESYCWILAKHVQFIQVEGSHNVTLWNIKWQMLSIPVGRNMFCYFYTHAVQLLTSYPVYSSTHSEGAVARFITTQAYLRVWLMWETLTSGIFKQCAAQTHLEDPTVFCSDGSLPNAQESSHANDGKLCWEHTQAHGADKVYTLTVFSLWNMFTNIHTDLSDVLSRISKGL